MLRFVPPGWWRRWPPLPFPPREYIDFRLMTMYGNTTDRPTPEELIRYLNWCRRMKGLK